MLPRDLANERIHAHGELIGESFTIRLRTNILLCCARSGEEHEHVQANVLSTHPSTSLSSIGTFVSTVNECHNGRVSRGFALSTDAMHTTHHETGSRKPVVHANQADCHSAIRVIRDTFTPS